jgi:hypothetical protein
MKYIFFLALVMSGFSFATFVTDPVPEIYEEIRDIKNPSIADLQKIQHKISHSKRPILEKMKDTAFIAENFKMIGESPDELPEFGHLVVNCSENNRENCIITYSSFNLRYPLGVKRLVKTIANSNFSGHLFYRIGGWPNINAGDLDLAHVPFAFKVCFFREMQKLGYRRVLWLDASILPVASLNKIFKMIETDGLFIQANSHPVGIYMSPETAAAFGITEEETSQIWSCSAAIIGIDFSNPYTANLIEKWYQAAKHPFGFFSPRSDQTALSILIYQKNLNSLMKSSTTLGEKNSIEEDTLFIMDRTYVK